MSAAQRSLFFAQPNESPGPSPEKPGAFCDPTVPEAAKPRLGGQKLAILERLRQGPATNRELNAIAIKYTNRISDLRLDGYVIKVVGKDDETGWNLYELLREPE